MYYVWSSALALVVTLLTGLAVVVGIRLTRTLRTVVATARRLDRAAEVLAGRLPAAEVPVVEHHEVLLRRLRAR